MLEAALDAAGPALDEVTEAEELDAAAAFDALDELAAFAAAAPTMVCSRAADAAIRARVRASCPANLGLRSDCW